MELYFYKFLIESNAELEATPSGENKSRPIVR